ncbi:MAG: hypothetical protein HFI60_16060 [Lachnospiraceae bacterium]|jgi:RNase P subunit RPR2|nr:hypothetical protein [Lachnospiraceae bacterium]
MGAVEDINIKMWINRKTYNNMMQRIERLESNQFSANEKVKQYIEDSETLANKLFVQINDLPTILKSALCNNCLDK